MRLTIFVLFLSGSLLHAADPAPFDDLDSGPTVPARLKESVYRRFLAGASPSGKRILGAAYYFDIVSKRFVLQPGLPRGAVSRIDAVLRHKNASSGGLASIWRRFIRINADIQQRVAALLTRVRSEPPLSDIRYLSTGATGFFVFCSPATGGVRVVRIGSAGADAAWRLDADDPVTASICPLPDGRYLVARMDGDGFGYHLLNPSGEPRGAPVRIPLAEGRNLRLVSAGPDRVLAAWQRDGMVYGGILDYRLGRIRRFPPFPGLSLLGSVRGGGLLSVTATQNKRLLILPSGDHGVTLKKAPPGTRAAEEIPLALKKDVSAPLYAAGALAVRFFPFEGGFYAAGLAGNDLLVRAFRNGRAGRVFPIYGSNIPAVILLILVISLVYGFIHASGPGHGKTLVAAYFVDNTHRGWWPPAKMALIVSAVHTGSALLLATVFQVILSVTPDQMAIRKYFTIGSGVVVILLGLYMLVDRLTAGRKGDGEALPSGAGRKTMLALGVAAGIVPCPLSMGVMIIAVVNGVYLLGLLSVLGMSVGMFVLLFLVGALTSRSRERLEKLLSRKGRAARFAGMAAGIGSAVVIMILGFALMAPVL